MKDVKEYLLKTRRKIYVPILIIFFLLIFFVILTTKYISFIPFAFCSFFGFTLIIILSKDRLSFVTLLLKISNRSNPEKYLREMQQTQNEIFERVDKSTNIDNVRSNIIDQYGSSNSASGKSTYRIAKDNKKIIDRAILILYKETVEPQEDLDPYESLLAK